MEYEDDPVLIEQAKKAALIMEKKKKSAKIVKEGQKFDSANY